jgi:hypothetical protein
MLDYLKTNWLKLMPLLLIALVVFFCSRTNERTDKLRHEGKMTFGRITKIEMGNKANIFFNYEFQTANGTVVSNSEIELLNYYNYFLNRSFPVIYDIKDPDNNELLITPHQFEALGQVFPDSLGWVKEYIVK